MPGFASLRRLTPSLALVCLLLLAPLTQAQANASEQAGKHEEALQLYNDALMQARMGKDATRQSLPVSRSGKPLCKRLSK